MVRILSFDVGIKNLAYCLVSLENKENMYDHKIEEWGVIDVMEKFMEKSIKC